MTCVMMAALKEKFSFVEIQQTVRVPLCSMRKGSNHALIKNSNNILDILEQKIAKVSICIIGCTQNKLHCNHEVLASAGDTCPHNWFAAASANL